MTTPATNKEDSMEKWIKEAKEAVEKEAAYAYEWCKAVASEQHVRLDWAVEIFIAGFKKIVQEDCNAE